MKTELIRTGDGSHSIFVPELREHYHSIHGAVEESNHVFIREGLLRCLPGPVTLFEVGFGTGLNVFLTLINAYRHKLNIVYHSIDNFLLPGSITDELNYPELSDSPKHIAASFQEIHQAPWNENVCLTSFFKLLKIQGDIFTSCLPATYDLVYFDAFGPDKQPELWTEPVFRKIFNAMNPGGIMVTYSAKGTVRSLLSEIGFIVERKPGAGKKRHMTSAVKPGLKCPYRPVAV